MTYIICLRIRIRIRGSNFDNGGLQKFFIVFEIKIPPFLDGNSLIWFRRLLHWISLVLKWKADILIIYLFNILEILLSLCEIIWLFLWKVKLTKSLVLGIILVSGDVFWIVSRSSIYKSIFITGIINFIRRIWLYCLLLLGI